MDHLTGVLLAVGLVALLVAHIRKAEATGSVPFPQGILPAQWFTSLHFFLVSYLSRFAFAAHFMVVDMVLALVTVTFFSWITFHLFSSRSRLRAELPEEDEVLHGLAETLRSRWLPATAILAAGTMALLAWRDYRPETIAALIDFSQLAVLTTIGFDLWEQFQWEKRQAAMAHLVQLDDVHFSYRLRALLKEEDIDPLMRAHHYRSLCFFFAALVKIDVMVPGEQLERAREVLARLKVAREVKVF